MKTLFFAVRSTNKSLIGIFKFEPKVSSAFLLAYIMFLMKFMYDLKTFMYLFSDYNASIRNLLFKSHNACDLSSC